jgi:lactoylglutathione lyase
MVFYTGGLTMKFTKAGIILNTQKYQECVDFYGAILSLDIMFKINRPGEKITTFALGDVYLMIEPDGHAQVGKKSVAACPTKFRFNVNDVQAECTALRRKGVQVEVIDHNRGTTAEFSDPDGNRCALRSQRDFGC